MPLAYIFVAMLVLWGGFYASQNYEENIRVKAESEAGAIAGNMIAFRRLVSEYALFRDNDNLLVNYTRYRNFQGLASDFIDQTPAEYRPDTMPWFRKIDGVDGWIQDGELYVYYDPSAQGAKANRAGLQSALLRATKDSTRVGLIRKSQPEP